MSAFRALALALPLAYYLLPAPARSGPNADGALIVHADPSIQYTQIRGDCSTVFRAPSSCARATTEIEPTPGRPTVVWLLAAFPENVSPSVAVAYFGITHTLPPGAILDYGACGPGAIEIPNNDWPLDPSGMSVGYYPAIRERLFPVYWLAVEGDYGDRLSTRLNPAIESAVFVDDVEFVEDPIRRFGEVRWGEPGSNECPPEAQMQESSVGKVKAIYRK